MEIKVESYQLTVTDNELWDLAFCIKAKLSENDHIQHWAVHGGVATFLENDRSLLKMLETISTRLGRVYLYNETVADCSNRIEALQKTKTK